MSADTMLVGSAKAAELASTTDFMQTKAVTRSGKPFKVLHTKAAQFRTKRAWQGRVCVVRVCVCCVCVCVCVVGGYA